MTNETIEDKTVRVLTALTSALEDNSKITQGYAEITQQYLEMTKNLSNTTQNHELKIALLENKLQGNDKEIQKAQDKAEKAIEIIDSGNNGSPGLKAQIAEMTRNIQILLDNHNTNINLAKTADHAWSLAIRTALLTGLVTAIFTLLVAWLTNHIH